MQPSKVEKCVFKPWFRARGRTARNRNNAGVLLTPHDVPPTGCSSPDVRNGHGPLQAIGVFGHDISGAPAVTAQQDPRYVLLKAKPPVRRARKADTISETAGADEDRVGSAAGVGGAGRSGGDSAGKGSASGSRADTISETAGADEDRVGSAAGVGGAGRSGAW